MFFFKLGRTNIDYADLKTRDRIMMSFLIVLNVSVMLFATDAYAPSMPAMAKFLNVDEDAIQLTLTINLFGMALFPFIYGFMVDRIGRRKTVIVGTGLFFIGSLLCTQNSNLDLLYLGRFLQGAGGASYLITGLVAIKSLYDKQQGAKVLALQGVAISATPALAPVIGGYIHVHLGWQWNFYIFVILG